MSPNVAAAGGVVSGSDPAPGRRRACAVRAGARLLLSLALSPAAAAPAAAQAARSPAPPGSPTGADGKLALPTVGRLHYEGGGDWYANPSSLPNLLRALAERTGLRVAERPVEVRPTDPDLGDHPFLYLTGHGNIRLAEAEVEALRRYLVGGGFLHADDNYGLDESFRREIRRVFPDRELVEVPLDHPVYRIFYEFPDGLPKVHEHDGLPARGFGIFVDGRLAVFYSWQSDLGDGWEDPEVHGDPPEVRESALRMGVNLFLYALAAAGPG